MSTFAVCSVNILLSQLLGWVGPSLHRQAKVTSVLTTSVLNTSVLNTSVLTTYVLTTYVLTTAVIDIFNLSSSCMVCSQSIGASVTIIQE